MENSKQPAFPLDNESYKRVDQGYFDMLGLTKREYFAGLAIQGILANPLGTNQKEGVPLTSSAIAVIALQHADALLKQLEK